MSEQIVETKVEKAAPSPQPAFNYADLTAFLDKYFENKTQAQQKAEQVLDKIETDGLTNNSSLQEVESWEEGLKSLEKEFAKTIDKIRDLLDYDDYGNVEFDSNYNTDKIKKYRQFWLHAHLLGGEKMAKLMIDRIRRSRKDYSIFQKI